VVDWSGGVFASCMPRVQLYVNACNGWPQFALQHHWLLPINCHFLRLYSAADRGIAAVSSAIEESDVYLYLWGPPETSGGYRGGGAGKPWPPYKPMSGRLTSCSRRKDKRIMVSSHKELNVANA